MAKKNTQKKSSGGATFAAAAATVAGLAGAYFLYGSKDAAKNRKKLKGWAVKARGEVLEKIEKSKEVSADRYNEIVEKVTDKYAKTASVGKVEADKLARELKKHWKEIEKELAPKSKKK